MSCNAIVMLLDTATGELPMLTPNEITQQQSLLKRTVARWRTSFSKRRSLAACPSPHHRRQPALPMPEPTSLALRPYCVSMVMTVEDQPNDQASNDEAGIATIVDGATAYTDDQREGAGRWGHCW